MKNLFKLKDVALIVACLLFMFLIGALMSFQEEKAKTLKVELPVEAWEVVLNVIEESSAPYKQVSSVKQVLLSQLQSQINESTVKDSLNNN